MGHFLGLQGEPGEEHPAGGTELLVAQTHCLNNLLSAAANVNIILQKVCLP